MPGMCAGTTSRPAKARRTVRQSTIAAGEAVKPVFWKPEYWHLTAFTDGFSQVNKVADNEVGNIVTMESKDDWLTPVKQEAAYKADTTAETQYYMALVLSGHGTEVVAMKSGCKNLKNPGQMKYWFDQLVALKIGTAAEENILRNTNWEVCQHHGHDQVTLVLDQAQAPSSHEACA
jgi:hypothetical protein